VLRSRAGRTLAPLVLDVMEARSAAVLRGLFDDPRLSVTQRSRRPFIGPVLRLAARHRIPLRFLRALARPAAVHRELDRIPADLRQRFALPDTATPADRLDLVERVMAADVFPVAPRAMPAAVAGFAMLGLAGKLLGTRLNPGELQTVLRGLPHNITTEMDQALWQLASRIREDAAARDLMLATPGEDLATRWRAGTLPPVVQQGLAEFLDRYGERAVAEIDLGIPRWSEDPRHILGAVTNYLRLDDPKAAPDAMFARSAQDAERMVSTLGGRAGPLRRPLVRFALGRARQLAGLREMPKYLLIVAFGALRKHLVAVGEALASQGRIAAADDVFLLDLVEARDALSGNDMHETVARRREEYEAELRRRHIPRVLLSDGTEPEKAHTVDAPDGSLRGTPASAGAVTGIARVILEPVGARLEPGEILVAPSTDPGWTPLFLTAGGLVMEMGGANSHGAVVAREYGIPAVVGVPDATSRIVTGQQITVDGTAGVVISEDSAVMTPRP
jgi:rifampicin phosphotransferase